jgi:hypothetical protein
MSEITIKQKFDYPGEGIRYVSEQVTVDPINGEAKPLLELTDTNDGILHVSFVRSGPGYTLDSLLNKALCYADANKFDRVVLEDDAYFPLLNGAPCIHRSIFHRAFEGKKGIYESKGWTARTDTTPFIQTITTYTKGQAKDLAKLLSEAKRAQYNNLLNEFSTDDTESFAKWVNQQPCEILNNFYNALLILSSPKWLEKIETTVQTREFLEALHNLKEANGLLFKIPACPSRGGIRRISLSSRRVGNKRRVSRSCKSNRKLSSRSRRNRLAYTKSQSR